MKRNEDDWSKITFKEAIKREPIYFLAITIALTAVFAFLADKCLTYFLNIGNTRIFTYNYSFGPLNLVFVIPAMFLARKILKIIYGKGSGGKVPTDFINKFISDPVYYVIAPGLRYIRKHPVELRALLSFLLSLLAAASLLGLDIVFDSADEAADGILLSLIVPFDIYVLMFGVPGAILGFISKGPKQGWSRLGKWGFFISLICVILSFTPIGDVLQIVGFTIASILKG